MPQCIILLFVVQFEFESLCSNLNLNVFVFLLEKKGENSFSAQTGPALLFLPAAQESNAAGPFTSPPAQTPHRWPLLFFFLRPSPSRPSPPAATDRRAPPVGVVPDLVSGQDSCQSRVRPLPVASLPFPSWPARQGILVRPYKGCRDLPWTPPLTRAALIPRNPSCRHWSPRTRCRLRSAAPPLPRRVRPPPENCVVVRITLASFFSLFPLSSRAESSSERAPTVRAAPHRRAPSSGLPLA